LVNKKKKRKRKVKNKRKKELKDKKKTKLFRQNRIGDGVLHTFSVICKAVLSGIRGENEFPTANSREDEAAERLWEFIFSAVSTARLFAIPDDLVTDMEMHLMEGVCGISTVKAVARANENVDGIPPPEMQKLLFPSVVVILEEPSVVSDEDLNKIKVLEDTHITEVALLGWLFAGTVEEPFIAHFSNITGIMREEEVRVLGVLPVYEKGEWKQTLHGAMESMAVLELLSSYGTYKEQEFSRGAVYANRKLFTACGTDLPVPKSYYTVTMKRGLVSQKGKGGGCHGRRFSYRFDVRGHERMYKPKRGALPLDPAQKAVLLKRGYRVYDGQPVKKYDEVRLIKRGHALPKEDEWIALLIRWIKDAKKGPEDAPYVPAVRRLG
jgi:hypothetical protein